MISIGFIGTGNISPVHLRYLEKRRDVRIAALCDINPGTLARRVGEYGGKPFDNYRKMLAALPLDAVWVCTPSKVRREMLIECARRRIPVFCEKPVERSEAKAARIARDLKKLRARVQIGYVFRSMPVIDKLRAAMRDDRIHLAQSLYACPMSLTRTLADWFFDKVKSGGALIDQATHNFDLLRCLLGDVKEVQGLARNPVQKKKAGYTIDETLSLSFSFANGVVGTHIHSWVSDAWRNEIVLSGEKRLYRLNLGTGLLTIDEKGAVTTFQQENGRMYEFENALFIKQVTSGNWKANPCEYADGLETLRLTLACDKAVTTGKKVSL